MTVSIEIWKWNRVFRRWECVKRNQSYEMRADSVAWLHAWPALVKKRLQSTIQHRAHPGSRTIA